jgi:hypothetical protein
MQFYGQDVMASTKAADPAMPYDFSVDPDGDNKGGSNLPLGSNFMFYNQVQHSISAIRPSSYLK